MHRYTHRDTDTLPRTTEPHPGRTLGLGAPAKDSLKVDSENGTGGFGRAGLAPPLEDAGHSELPQTISRDGHLNALGTMPPNTKVCELATPR